MKVALIGTKTGHGHISPLNAINERLVDLGIETLIEKSFPEDKLLGYDFLSDFYNYLLKNSLELSNMFTEMLAYTRSDKSGKFIDQSSGIIVDYIVENDIDILVSFAPYINYSVANAIKILNKKILFTTVVTDPFLPYMSGYDCPFLDYYYVASEDVMLDLEKKGIHSSKIILSGFPVARKYFSITVQEKKEIRKKLGFDDRKIILCNSGAEGNPHFLRYISAFSGLGDKFQYIFVCGKNSFLKESCKNILSKLDNISVYITGFVDNLHELLSISDLHITKPGANTIFESLSLNVPVFVDGCNGILYQEIGIINYIKQQNIGYVYNKEVSVCIEDLLKGIMSDQNLNAYKDKILELRLNDSASVIASHLKNLPIK